MALLQVDGYLVSTAFVDEFVREALRYKPHPDDILIVSDPKCGTTWMQHIMYNILNSRPPPRGLFEQSTAMPFLELQGAEHIYINRSPYDYCLSYYYHTKGLPEYRFQDGTFDEIFDMFLEGLVDFADYFEQGLSWYARRFDDNVLFVAYEDLKKDTAIWIMRIADYR
ncbi:hypothetical protein HPB52_006321 [Rhipicephalus sanguineus]|uniref:Sulfotransferase domain-containing protein n=1 Tax=Rhipicephalus sanguineus TaxID=34632 RepID=A0A9D4T5C8_RHISA|nr:hypothetical protein HPB52_006321 [Rhipicephalus sanguineus]